MANWVINNNWSLDQEDGSNPVDFDTDTIKMALVTSATAPNPDTDTVFPGSFTQVTGTGYTAGGETIANMSAVKSTTTVTVSGDDTTWLENAGGFSNARYAVLYRDGSVDTIVATLDFGSNQGNTTSDFIVTSPNGFFTKTLS